MTTEDLTEYRPVAAIAEAVTGRRPSPPAVHRWIHGGSTGVRLQVMFLHRTWHTTRTLFLQFLQERSAKRLKRGDVTAPAERPPSTKRKLEELGLTKDQ